MRSTKKLMDIVARVLRNISFGLHFLADKELPQVLRKSLAKNVNDTYDLLGLRITSYSQNTFVFLYYNNVRGTLICNTY